MKIRQTNILGAAVNTLALAGVLAVNAMANILPINGLNTGQVSALYPSLFTPAGITFSIWSIIYLLLIGFVALQWFGLNDTVTSGMYKRITPLFIISGIFNMTWIIAWHYLYVWASVLIMILLLITLTVLFMKLQQEQFSSNAERVLISLPFTIYFAWICVATIANISTALIAMNWNAFGVPKATWTIIMLMIAFVLAALITIRYRKAAFAAVFIWALTGIYIRWSGNTDHHIAMTAIVLAAMLGVVLLYTLRKSLRVS